MKMDRMGVIVLMAHLIITLTIIIGYLVLSILNKNVTDFSYLLIAAVSYWFGAMGSTPIRKPTNTDNADNNDQKGA